MRWCCAGSASCLGLVTGVYKNYDPRAKIIKKLADEVFSIVGRDPLVEVRRRRTAADPSEKGHGQVAWALS